MNHFEDTSPMHGVVEFTTDCNEELRFCREGGDIWGVYDRPSGSGGPYTRFATIRCKSERCESLYEALVD